MTGYVLSVAADLDLDEIWEYIVHEEIPQYG
jgi:plasmid stabilization system protein ParE